MFLRTQNRSSPVLPMAGYRQHSTFATWRVRRSSPGTIHRATREIHHPVEGKHVSSERPYGIFDSVHAIANVAPEVRDGMHALESILHAIVDPVVLTSAPVHGIESETLLIFEPSTP